MSEEVDLVRNPGYDVDQAAGEIVVVDPFDAFTSDWLRRRQSEETRQAYRRDVHEYLAWCVHEDVHPMSATFATIEDYRSALETLPNSWTGKPPSRATVARKVSAVSSWYKYMRKLGEVTVNPAADAERPKFDRDHTDAVGFTAEEATSLLAAARADHWLGEYGGYAIARFLIDLGARVSDACRLEIEDIGHDSGHRTVKLKHMKGGKMRTRAAPPQLGEALDAWLLERGCPAAGPVFAHPDGSAITRQEVARFVRRIAKGAGLPAAAKISPHSFRHAWNTVAKQRGASLEERQHALGHADPRTTQRYDRARASLDRDPSYLVAAAVSG